MLISQRLHALLERCFALCSLCQLLDQEHERRSYFTGDFEALLIRMSVKPLAQRGVKRFQRIHVVGTQRVRHQIYDRVDAFFRGQTQTGQTQTGQTQTV